jgi:hypothetical protein
VGLPKLEPRVKQTDKGAGLSVEGTDIASFPDIASKAGIGEVSWFRLSAMFPADDVVNLMRRVRIFFVDQAIFTPVTGAIGNQSP